MSGKTGKRLVPRPYPVQNAKSRREFESGKSGKNLAPHLDLGPRSHVAPRV